MIDEWLRSSARSPTNGRRSARRVPDTESERLLSLELTQDDHTHQIDHLRDEVRHLGTALREDVQQRKARDQVKAEIKEARRNAAAFFAVAISALMLMIAASRFVLDYRPAVAPLSATTVPGRG